MAKPHGSADAADLIREADVAAPMRDGVLLRGDVFRPAGPGRFPALILRTPYGRTGDPDELRFARRAVGRGYAVVLQDVRGRHGSEGAFTPHAHEGRDGFDSIEWLAAQPWCDGRVGSFGLSYAGSVQWFAALENPPHLLAMAPAMTFARLRDAVRSQGVLDMDWLRWAFVAIAPDLRARAGLPGPADIPAAEADWARRGATLLATLPLLDLPELDGCLAFLRDWLTHPQDDSWWDFGDVAGKYDRVTAAVLNLAGWHDDAFTVAGAVENHRGLVAARARQDAEPRSMLVLGPWSHGINAVTGDARFGTRDFGPAARLDYDGLVLDFMDRHVRGRRNVLAGVAPVSCFFMGGNAWREGPEWPPAGTREFPLHLAAGLEQAAGVGRLALLPPDCGPEGSVFAADPARPVAETPGSGLGAVDHADLRGPGVLLFETAPLASALTVAGRIRAEIFLTADVPDLDLYVRLLDVAPGGAAFNLMDIGAEVARVGLLGGPLAADEVRRVPIDTPHTANVFLAGHRVRLAVFASWRPGMSLNLQTGASEVASAAMRPACVTIRHCAAQPSRIILPLLPPPRA